MKLSISEGERTNLRQRKRWHERVVERVNARRRVIEPYHVRLAAPPFELKTRTLTGTQPNGIGTFVQLISRLQRKNMRITATRAADFGKGVVHVRPQCKELCDASVVFIAIRCILVLWRNRTCHFIVPY